MTRTAITVENAVINTKAALTGVAVSNANDHYIDAKGNTQGLLLVVNNTSTDTGTLTFIAGDNPPAFEAGLGDSSAQNCVTGITVFSLDGGRWCQDDGTINVDAASFTGTVTLYAIRTPKSNR